MPSVPLSLAQKLVTSFKCQDMLQHSDLIQHWKKKPTSCSDTLILSCADEMLIKPSDPRLTFVWMYPAALYYEVK